MDALDGNAIAGALHDYFGVEMTTARGCCAHCGSESEIAQLVVYVRCPGVVVRCCHCDRVVLVLVETADSLRVDVRAFHLQGAPSPPG
jgi:hypothetical protein